MGNLLTCSPRITFAQLRMLRSTQQSVRATEKLKSSHRPDGKNADALALTLAWQLWLALTLAWQLWPTLLSTTVCTCHRDLKISHRPDGKFADALALTLAWQLWPTLLSTPGCTCRRNLKFSHCPHGRLTSCSFFAGRRCLCQWWLSDH